MTKKKILKLMESCYDRGMNDGDDHFGWFEKHCIDEIVELDLSFDLDYPLSSTQKPIESVST